jgi:hypothetical protein
LFAIGVVDTGGKFAASVLDTGGNLPPVSTTLVKLVAKFAAGVIIPVANLPTVLLIPVVHPDLRISP